MLQIDDTIISFELFERKFICDLASCKGACCIEGDEGAPLEAHEVDELQKALPVVWDDLSADAKELIEKQGVSYKDRFDEEVTSIVNGAECVFMYYDENGYAKCAVEKAYLAGKLSFRKPISCYLYPVRVQQHKNFKAVNYNHWHICECAEALGEKEGVPVYKFLREPLIAKFGEEWYKQLEIADKEIMGL